MIHDGIFHRVRLAEPHRRCLDCVIAGLHGLDRHGHARERHRPADLRRYPARWRVSGAEGDELADGSILQLIDIGHKVFYEWNGSEVIDWLFEVRGATGRRGVRRRVAGGPQRGRWFR